MIRTHLDYTSSEAEQKKDLSQPLSSKTNCMLLIQLFTPCGNARQGNGTGLSVPYVNFYISLMLVKQRSHTFNSSLQFLSISIFPYLYWLFKIPLNMEFSFIQGQQLLYPSQHRCEFRTSSALGRNTPRVGQQSIAGHRAHTHTHSHIHSHLGAI